MTAGATSHPHAVRQTVQVQGGSAEVEIVELQPMAKIAFRQFQEQMNRQSQELMRQAAADLGLNPTGYQFDGERLMFWRPAPPLEASQPPANPPLSRAAKRRMAKAQAKAPPPPPLETEPGSRRK